MPSASKPAATPDLYCITDPDLNPLPIEEQVYQMIDGGARIIQLRAKNLDDAQFRLAAQKCLTIAHWAEALFLVNDRVEIAASIGADGVHLGQEDMSPNDARRILGDEAVVGLSTHTFAQFTQALQEPVSYIALGPVFGTTTKENPDPEVGLDLVKKAVELLANDYRPLVLIGGITLEKIPILKEAAPKAFYAVIADVVRSQNLADRVRRFRTAIRGEH